MIDNAICTPEPTFRPAGGAAHALQHGYLSHSTTATKKFRISAEHWQRHRGFVIFDIQRKRQYWNSHTKKARELPRDGWSTHAWSCEYLLAALARSLRTQLLVGDESCFLGLEQRSRCFLCRFHRPLYGGETVKLCKSGICICIASDIATALDLAFQ